MRAKVLVFALLLVAGTTAGARWAWCFEATEEKQAVEDIFLHGLSESFRARDVDKVLSFYDEGAVIVTYSMGRGDKKLFSRFLLDDFARFETVDSSIVVNSVMFESEVATAKVQTTEIVSTGAGIERTRRGKYYYRLIKNDGEWKITLQSYREDFGVTNIHGRPKL